MRRWVILVLFTGLFVIPAAVSGQESNRVGLVVQFGDGRLVTQCIEFNKPSITGREVLEKAGLSLTAEYSALGVAVCRIEENGCDFPTDTCFCQCEGSPCTYWVYHHLLDGAWHYSGFGASTYELHDGDVDGWAWGEGNLQGGTQPPVLTFEQICGSRSNESEITPELVDSGGLDQEPVEVAALDTDFRVAADTEVPWSDGAAGLDRRSDPSLMSDTIEDASQALPHVPVPENGRAGYATFGLITIGLLGWLLVAVLRKRGG